MKLSLSKQAYKDIKKLQAKEARKLVRTIDNIEKATSIQEIPHVCFLKGSDSDYRIEIGKDYRALVTLHEKDNEIIIKTIVPRGNAYGNKK